MDSYLLQYCRITDWVNGFLDFSVTVYTGRIGDIASLRVKQEANIKLEFFLLRNKHEIQ